MTERDFKYWLQGYAEICGDVPTKEQWAMIREHLELTTKSAVSVSVSSNYDTNSDSYHERIGIYQTPFAINPQNIPISC